MKRIFRISFWGILGSVLFGICLAEAADTYKDELQRFKRDQITFVRNTETYWNCITDLEQMLVDYPDTFLKGDILTRLLSYYGKVTHDPVLLGDIADRLIAAQNNSDNAYELAAQVFVEAGVHSEKTLFYAQKAFDGALKKQARWNGYEQGFYRRGTLLAKACELAGHHERAIKEMQQQIVRLQGFEHYNTLAGKQYVVDQARMVLLHLYADQKQWRSVYDLACKLMKTSVVRDGLPELWSQAYVGRFGSGKKMVTAYAELKSQWAQQVIAHIETERISRSAPRFAVETLDGDSLRLADLTGKVVVVSFWAGWCSPCIAELPYFEQLKQRFRDVEFLAINIDRDMPNRRDMVISNHFEHGMGLTFAMGDLALRKSFGSEEIPYTCIIDPVGRIRYERKGMGPDLTIAMTHQLQWVLGEGGK